MIVFLDRQYAIHHLAENDGRRLCPIVYDGAQVTDLPPGAPVLCSLCARAVVAALEAARKDIADAAQDQKRRRGARKRSAAGSGEGGGQPPP